MQSGLWTTLTFLGVDRVADDDACQSGREGVPVVLAGTADAECRVPLL